MTIEQHADVRGYFRERLVKALSHQRIATQEATEFYLVNLLADYAIRPDEAMFGRTLFDMYAEASEAAGSERIRRFRDLGDNALYVCGFFGDHLKSRGVSRTYAITMGERGYSTVSVMLDRSTTSESGFARVYEDLAGNFEGYVRVLDDVREETALRTPQDIIRLYERWQQTKSPLLAERLERAGVFPQISADRKRGGALH